jgi:hypothetical protein
MNLSSKIYLEESDILNMVKNEEITEDEVIDFINNRTCSL